MMSFEETMRAGEAEYADVLTVLRARGLSAEFTQTGGMCAALLVPLEAGHSLLVTDAEDTLSWSRSEHQGWAVGLYDERETARDDGPLAFRQTPGSQLGHLLPLIDAVLADGATGRT